MGEYLFLAVVCITETEYTSDKVESRHQKKVYYYNLRRQSIVCSTTFHTQKSPIMSTSLRYSANIILVLQKRKS